MLITAPYSWPSPQIASDVLSRAAEQCDMIVGNDEEFGFMAGDYSQGLEKARALSASAAIVIYKMGDKGAISFANGEEIKNRYLSSRSPLNQQGRVIVLWRGFSHRLHVVFH